MRFSSSSGPGNFAGRFVWRGWLVIALFLAGAMPTFAVNRLISITAPKSASTGSPITVSVAVTTDAGGGEQIGFFHAQYSVDGGATWTGFCFQEKAGRRATRTATFVAGPAGSQAIVRVRIAFRGGKDGDVDYEGQPIVWTGSWDKWLEPPAKIAVIKIKSL